MKRIIIVHGLIAGVIVSSMFYITFPFVHDGGLNGSAGMWLGYTSMVLAFSMIFVGTKTYRDQHLNGSISFGQAFKIGILITAIASLMYATSWEFYFNLFAPDFAEKYTAGQLKQMVDDGKSATEFEAAREQMKQMVEMYKNPIIRFAMTLMEILPVGLIITLISSALFRRKQFLPKSVNA